MRASERFLFAVSKPEVGLASGITLPGRDQRSEAQLRVPNCETQDLETTSRDLVCVTPAWASPGEFGAWAVLPTSSSSTQHPCRRRARQGLFKAARLLEKREPLLFSSDPFFYSGELPFSPAGWSSSQCQPRPRLWFVWIHFKVDSLSVGFVLPFRLSSLRLPFSLHYLNDKVCFLNPHKPVTGLLRDYYSKKRGVTMATRHAVFCLQPKPELPGGSAHGLAQAPEALHTTWPALLEASPSQPLITTPWVGAIIGLFPLH